MAYIAPIHRPSSVRHARRINLFSSDEESLVVAKANRIEIWRFNEQDELNLFHSQRVYGTISMLEALQPKDSETELLFVGTDRFDYFTLTWDAVRRCLRTVDNFHDVGEKHLRDSQSQDRCLVDPSGRYMALLLWEGVLSVLRMKTRRDKARNLDWMDQVRLSELFIKACTFLYSETGHPKIALLYQSQSDRRDTKLASYRLTSDDRDTVVSQFDPLKDRELNLTIDDPGAAMLIPVEKVESEKRHNVRHHAPGKAYLGGLLVVGETQLLYIDDTTKQTVEVALRAPAIFVAWARYDATHYFLGDDYGVLRLLTILTNGMEVTSLDVRTIGKTSRPSCLVYVESNRMLYVGSHNGDSQLYRINLNWEGTETSDADELAADGPTYCELVQVFNNIGPILDFAVMDMGNREDDKQLANEYSSGQARIVTGSGVHKDGSLRSVRSGVGLEDIGILNEFDNVRALFSLRLRSTTPARKADTLVVSLLTETRVFVFDSDGGIEEVDNIPGLTLEQETLWAENLTGGGHRLLQVTSNAVTIVEADSGVTVASWTPPEGQAITSASANERWALLSVGGKLLVSLSLEKDLAVVAQKDFGEDQIACIHAAPQLLDTGVVGTWTAGAITLVDLATLQPTQTSESVRHKEDTTSVPRRITLVQVLPPEISGPTLFVAMDDGTVVTFTVSPDDKTLQGRKSVVLGTRHANLHLLPQSNGTYNVFATTEHPSLIYGSEGRIIYAAVTALDANIVCPFDAEAYPGAIAVATYTQIKLARPDTKKQTHVQTVQMGASIRRIAYSPVERVFALGCIARELSKGREIVTCSVQLVDEILFQPLGKPLMLDTDRRELIECVVRAEMTDSQGRPADRFLVGTSYLTNPQDDTEADDASNGRLIVVGVETNRGPYIVASHRMRGPVRCLATLDDMIVLGLSKTVILAKHIETTGMSGTLRKVASFRTSTYVVDLAVQGNLIAIGDLMKSTAIIEYVPPTPVECEKGGEESGAAAKSQPSLVGRARNYQASWVTAVCPIEDETWLEADGHGNLSVLERNVDGVTDEDRRRLRSTSDMNLGEMVNRIRPIAVETSPNAMVHPKAFLATVEGSIYMFGTVAAGAQDMLMRLQAKLEATVTGLGNTTFSSYRGFRNSEREAGEPNRFLDGEMLERFLDLDEELQKEVAQGLGPSVEDLRNSIEELKRLH